MTTEVETLRKELNDLKAALASGKDLKTLTPVKIDMTYLCPKDPNRDKIVKANGVVLPEDGPTHTRGWITDQKNVGTKHQMFDPNTGKQVQFESLHQTATWICQTCGSEIKLDPYRV